MSEAARARERLDFEVAAEAIEKGKEGNESKPTGHKFIDLLTVGGMQFTSGGTEVHFWWRNISFSVNPGVYFY